MRKILTKEEIEAKDRRNKFIIGAILVVLMVFSTAGYAFYQGDKENSSKIKYNGIKFTQEGGLWYSTIENYQFVTTYNPKDTENITNLAKLGLASLNNKVLYFSYDSERDAVSEIVQNFERFAGRVQFVCIGECSEDYPVKNCSNDNIISIEIKNETIIKQEENCVYITASSEELLKATDAFIFKTLGI